MCIVKSDPINRIDPSGEGWITDTMEDAWEGAKNALTWIWNESNELQKNIQRKFWSTGADVILRNGLGCATSAWMIEYSLQNNRDDI